MKNKYGILGDRDPAYERRREACDFRNNSNATFNYIEKCIESGVESLREDGVSSKEIQVFVDRTLEKILDDCSSKNSVLSKETENALAQINEARKLLENSRSHTERELARKIEEDLETFSKRFGIEVENIETKEE